MLRFVLAMVPLVAAVPPALGADEAIPPQPPAPVAQASPSQSAPSEEQARHLQAAAEHLAKAGRKAEAARLREQAAAAESGRAAALLARKEKELDRLQSEVEQLRKLARKQPQISIAFQVLQLSRERLKQHDIPNLNLLLRNAADTVQFEVIEKPQELAELVEELRKRELVKVLAEPTIVTVSGRPASFHSGGEVPALKPGAEPPASIDYVRFGTEVDAVPIVLGDDKLRLEFRLRLAEIDPKQSARIRDASIPGVRSFTVDTGVEMRLGQAVVLGGMLETRRESELGPNGKLREMRNEIQTIIVVTPRRVDLEQATAPHTGRSSYGLPHKGAFYPQPINFGGVTPRIIHQEEEEERLIPQ